MAHVVHRPALKPMTLASLLANTQKRLSVWRSRRALAELDARALEDIGVSPAQAHAEARLSIWDVPANWKGR
ncbi:MAG: DUF1127 domain-containing protein [Roseobacter sp.]